jgi:hypothetical protein
VAAADRWHRHAEDARSAACEVGLLEDDVIDDDHEKECDDEVPP